jgi:uncharacterized protein (TIGR02453 family)
MSTKKRAYFQPALFKFLRELTRNNRREWFSENKQRYEAEVRDPTLAFITAFGPALAKISPRFSADPRPVGGSMFRIYRDTRFSKDKSPYKTHVGAAFSHASATESLRAPVFYLHLAAGEVFAGCGIWHPPPPLANKIRQAIIADSAGWKRSISGKAFRSMCTLSGESLVRPPRGVDPEHPLIEDLKRKDFTTMSSFSEADACRPDFLEQFTATCRANAPLMAFLTRAVGLKW